MPCEDKETAFRYPDGFKRKGRILNCTNIDYFKHEHGHYALRIERIRWSDGEEAIRFAYYVRKPEKQGEDDWKFGAQYAWVFPVDKTREQIEQAKERGLFD